MSESLDSLRATGLYLSKPVHKVGKLTAPKDIKKFRNIPPKKSNKDQVIDPENGNLSMWQMISNNDPEEVPLA